jgi:hypothetical protein
MSDPPRQDAGSSPHSVTESGHWKRGWKWRVYLWAIVLSVFGLITGANTDVQNLLGVGGGLAMIGFFGGWFTGAALGFGIEAMRAKPPA